MSVDQKVGQLFLIGFPQQSVDPQLESFVKKHKISSFILFKRNISSLAQVAKMNAQLQKLALASSETLPFIAVDQEGGQVARVPTRPPIPNAMSIGQTQNSELAHSLGQETAKIIRTLGFNMNLAPVLDISSPNSDSFIGLRSFGSDASKVSSIGVSLSKGLLDEAVVPTAKHFPGVGGVIDDPHKKTASYKASAETLYERDIKPFEEFSKLGPNTAIMLSHFSYPTLDPTNTPATISPQIIKEILRKQIGYTGLVITDDIQMKGLTAVSNPHEAALQALKAGADIIMMTWSFKDQAKAIERVKEAVKKGELTTEELNEKVARILAVKKYLAEKSPQQGELQNPKVIALSTKKLREIESRILDFNIKMALQKPQEETERAPAAVPPSNINAKNPVCVFAPMGEFIDSFKKSSVPVIAIKTTAKTKAQMLVDFMKKSSCSYAVYAIYGRKTAVILDKLPKDIAKKILVVNLNTPSLIPDSTKFLNVVNLYFPHPEAGKKVADNFRGLARRGDLGQFAKTD
ncbi:glycoside hydrolase family 3 protein [Bdellovibrio sp. HCB337]|uniref:glycoside hydrolase family 3 protein n=1 Tax=Bdellovibrio sp. HCB337 TaxID=3394358 RepID=UPI0039A74C4A